MTEDAVIDRDEGALTSRAVPGPALYQMSVVPRGDALRAVVGLVPGYADHVARYTHVIDAWAARGIGTVGIDVRGHGRATGPRGCCSRFEEYLDDADELTRLVVDRSRGAPMFLFGHSTGGLIAAASLIDRPSAHARWRGLILSSPYLRLAREVSGAQVLAAKVAARVAPKLPVPTGIRGTDLTHDAERARAYEQDPLVFKNARARWLTETLRAQERVLARASTLTLPLYVLSPQADPVASPAAVRELYEEAASVDKKLDVREGLLHETLNEKEWPEIASAIADWILERV